MFRNVSCTHRIVSFILSNLKVNSHYNRVESQRRLNLKQYVILYREIDDQVSNLNAIEQEKGHLSSLPSNICASAIFDG